jgi:hypothetical protein
MWEYRYEVLSANAPPSVLTELLNQIGAEGWELVAFDFQDRKAVFKRPKRKPAPVYGTPECPYDVDET